MKFRPLLPVLFAVFFAATQAFAFRLNDAAWSNGSIVMVLSLGDGKPLSDGLTFNQSASDALDIWNHHMVRVQFAPVVNASDVPADGDLRNSAFFSSTIYGEAFGASTLAVTLRHYRNDSTITEADVIFNTGKQFDSYRGGLRSPVYDFHRVALHEFGHVLGLDHPDDAGQHVVAVMNAFISNLDVLQKDDITGAHYLYGNPNPAPAPTPGNKNNLVNLSTRASVGAGDDRLIGGFIIQGPQSARVLIRAIGPSLESLGIANALQDPTLEIHSANGALLFSNDDWTGNDNAQEIIDTGLAPSVQYESAVFAGLPAGNYTAVVSDFESRVGVGLVEVYDLQATNSRAANISTRGRVQTGESVMIGGVIVGGSQTKQIVVRGIGPSLASSNVVGSLQDPTLELHDSTGALLASNDNWQEGADAQTIQNSGLAPTDPHESALLATVNPGAYTAILRGVNGSTGIGLVEAYDLSPAP